MRNSLLAFLLATVASGFSSKAQDTLTIYFETNSYSISNQENSKLKDFVELYNNKKVGPKVQIVGYTDYIGKSTANLILSKKRAESVKNQFLKQGIKGSDISKIIGIGASECNHSISSKDGCKLHRKADIIYTKTLTQKIITQKLEEPIPIPEKKIEPVKETFSESIENTEVGETILLNNINFVGGSDAWLEESIPALETLIETMIENKTLKIEIQGHICCDTLDRNDLSTRRAFAIYNLLIKNGIDKSRLKYKGFGRTRPLLNNPQETNNRRVEILIIEK